MDSDTKNIVNLDLKREEKILDFNDFQKQNIKFDIKNFKKLITNYQTKKFDDGGGYLTLEQFV